jgi:hypothetical protein
MDETGVPPVSSVFYELGVKTRIMSAQKKLVFLSIHERSFSEYNGM